MKITLIGTPPSTSHIYKYRNAGKFIMSYMSKAGKEKKEEYRYEMIQQWQADPLPCDIKLEVDYYFGDKIKRDIDNFGKLWMDAGTGIIWDDDCQIQELLLRKHYDKENPRIEIKILSSENS